VEHYISLAFLAAGIILIVLEMASLTFYMAALAFASFLTAFVTWVYPMQDWQSAVVFMLGAVVAFPLAHMLRRHMQHKDPDPLADMDKGSHVTVAEVNTSGLKVKYRGSLWEALWDGSGAPQVGQNAEVVAREGSRLRVKAI